MLEADTGDYPWFDLLFLERRYEKWVVYFLALCDSLSYERFWGTCTRLSVSEHYKEKLCEMRQKAWQVLETMQARVAGGKSRWSGAISTIG